MAAVLGVALLGSLGSVAETAAQCLWSSLFFPDFSGCRASPFALIILAVMRPQVSEDSGTFTEHGEARDGQHEPIMDPTWSLLVSLSKLVVFVHVGDRTLY